MNLSVLSLVVLSTELCAQHGVEAVDGVRGVPSLHQSPGLGRSQEVGRRERRGRRGAHTLQSIDDFIAPF